MSPIDTEFSSFGYHGTATSTTVAHENRNVRLVLVERQLGSESSLQTNFPCIAQSDIDQLVDLLNDPQVYAAFVNQPAQIDSELATAQTTYDVGIVNESFGAASRQTLEMLQRQVLPDARRPVGLLRAARQGDQRSQRHHQRAGGPHRAGGRQRRRRGSTAAADSLSCDLGDPKSLLVGAYNPGTLAQNMFSNYGACVNVYAPGQAIVVEYAGGWLTWASGTSFAAPLTARYASMTAAVAVRSDHRADRGASPRADPTSQFLPVSLFPSRLLLPAGDEYPEFVVPAGAAKAAAGPPSADQVRAAPGVRPAQPPETAAARRC